MWSVFFTDLYGHNILGRVNMSHASLLHEVAIYGSQLPPKQGICRCTQYCCLTVHGPAPADDKIRIIEQIGSVQCRFRDQNIRVTNGFYCLRLRRNAWEENQQCVRTRCHMFQNLIEKGIFKMMIQRPRARWSQHNNDLFR